MFSAGQSKTMRVCWLIRGPLCLCLGGCAGALWGPGLLEDDPEVEQKRAYNLLRLNALREAQGLAPYAMDDCLNAIAERANDEWILSQEMHGQFERECLARPTCECSWTQENMGYGRSTGATWKADLDASLELMMREGPGGGHHDNIVSTQWTRVGIGIRIFADTLYFTNDFGL